MDSCRLIYFTSVVGYNILFYFGWSWIHPEEAFTWSRFVFLSAMLLLMDKYKLVPSPLSCPPFYPFYKVVAALIVANMVLMTIWVQTEDFLKWLLLGIASLFEYVPLINRKLEFGENPNVVEITQLLVSGYFLFWVIKSSGYIQKLTTCPRPGNQNSRPQTPQTPGRRNRRSTAQ